MYEKLKLKELRLLLNDPAHVKERPLIAQELKNRFMHCEVCGNPTPVFCYGIYGLTCRSCQNLLTSSPIETPYLCLMDPEIPSTEPEESKPYKKPLTDFERMNREVLKSTSPEIYKKVYPDE